MERHFIITYKSIDTNEYNHEVIETDGGNPTYSQILDVLTRNSRIESKLISLFEVDLESSFPFKIGCIVYPKDKKKHPYNQGVVVEIDVDDDTINVCWDGGPVYYVSTNEVV